MPQGVPRGRERFGVLGWVEVRPQMRRTGAEVVGVLVALVGEGVAGIVGAVVCGLPLATAR